MGPAELAGQVLERYAAGDSVQDIAGTLGVGAMRVYGLLRARGVVRKRSEGSIVREARKQRPELGQRPGDGISAALEAEIVARYEGGESGQALARAYGLKECRVYRLLRERTLSNGSSVLRSKSEAARLRQRAGRAADTAGGTEVRDRTRLK